MFYCDFDFLPVRGGVRGRARPGPGRLQDGLIVPHPWDHVVLRYTVAFGHWDFLQDYAVDPVALAESARASGEYFIFTSPEGDPARAGIREPVEVVHDDYQVYWRLTRPYGFADTDPEADGEENLGVDGLVYTGRIAIVHHLSCWLLRMLWPHIEVLPANTDLGRLLSLEVDPTVITDYERVRGVLDPVAGC